MELTQIKPNGTAVKEMKPGKAKAKRLVPFPLELNEAYGALREYIKDNYGVTLDVSKLQVQDGYLIVSGEALAK